MKVVIGIAVMVGLVLAQVTGGGYSTTEPQVVKSGSDHLYQSGHFDFAFVIPVGDFSEPSRFPFGLEPLGSKLGIKFNVGKLYYIKALEQVWGKKFGFGIDASFVNMRMTFLNWDNVGYTDYGGNYNVDMGVGVGFGVNLATNLTLETYYRVDFGFAGFFSPTSSTSGGDVSGISIFDGLMSDFGLRMRYNRFFFALDFKVGSLTFKNSSNSDVTFSDHKLSQSSFNISLGKSF